MRQVRNLTAEERRRIRIAGQVAGGVTGAAAGLSLLSAGVLLRQAADARRIIPLAEAPPPRGDGLYGPKFPGRPLSMVILGDSSAAGYGVHRPRETPGALLATGVSRRLRRPVRLHRVAVVGATSAGLPYQVDAALEYDPEVAVIIIGGNDVTHVSARTAAVRHLADAVRRLRAVGCKVVVGTCPDIGAIQPIKPPLRWLATTWSRQLAAQQTVAVVEAGGRTVSLCDLLGPAFVADPVRMFGSDRFHPSVEGYARAAAVIMPTLMAVLGEEEDRMPATGPDGVRSLSQAAHEAVRAAGTEVSAAKVDGRDRGPAGRWAQLRRHPWFGEPRSWLGHRALTFLPSGLPVSGMGTGAGREPAGGEPAVGGAAAGEAAAADGPAGGADGPARDVDGPAGGADGPAGGADGPAGGADGPAGGADGPAGAIGGLALSGGSIGRFPLSGSSLGGLSFGGSSLGGLTLGGGPVRFLLGGSALGRPTSSGAVAGVKRVGAHVASRMSARVARGSGRTAAGAVGWTSEDHQATVD
ncbi:lysophospholipase L1-like esterase [Couchioplanes caeruleus]|uniref:Lysophospholipase L1-like esterase n=1 Tax=Couchioplanes caeruleus TaxID=56438 RepID=A0A3N1GIK4_9ACTN|nr:lysophospholipase L1-like esterase [Couchioplanes caeruleus]